MKSIVYYLLSICLLAFYQNCSAQDESINQLAIGEWRTHLTYFNAQTLAISPKGVYVASKNGLFFYDTEFNNTEVISKIDGLSDIEISALTYLPTTDELLIAYNNGNIDFLSETRIQNLPTFFNNSTFLDKQIYHSYRFQNIVWLSTSVGILEIDTESKQIRASYQNLGENGEQIKIFATTIFDNKLYAATERGVRFVSLAANVNRNDFRNWQTQNNTTNKIIDAIGSTQNDVFFAIRNEGVFNLSNRIDQLPNQRIFDIYTVENKAFFASQTNLYQLENTTLTTVSDNLIQAPREVVQENGVIWIADERNGLVTNQSGSFASIFPSGTYSPNTWTLEEAAGKIIVLSGGYESNFRPFNRTSGFYVFENNQWTNYNAENLNAEAKPIPNVKDLVAASYSKAENKVFFASMQNGILVWDLQNDTFSVLDSSNSPLPHNRVIDVETDANGNLWIALSVSDLREDAYLRKTPTNEWKAFQFGQTRTAYPIDIEIDANNNIWARLSRFVQGGVLVFNENGENIILTETPNNGNLPSNEILALKNDKEGVIWLGTNSLSSASVRTYADVFSIFRSTERNARDVFFESRQLLRDETITCIEVDGGNRKWFGTENGAWLFAANANEQFHHFTTENSPLLSNTILDIEVQDETGEVFFATPIGIVSYKGTSTEPKSSLSNVKIYPNPVRPDFNGVVAIEGLTQNATIKITDISGRLVYETESFGGTATWNGADYNNAKAKSGVYLVYVTNTDGTEGFVGKIVFIE